MISIHTILLVAVPLSASLHVGVPDQVRPPPNTARPPSAPACGPHVGNGVAAFATAGLMPLRGEPRRPRGRVVRTSRTISAPPGWPTRGTLYDVGKKSAAPPNLSGSGGVGGDNGTPAAEPEASGPRAAVAKDNVEGMNVVVAPEPANSTAAQSPPGQLVGASSPFSFLAPPPLSNIMSPEGVKTRGKLLPYKSTSYRSMVAFKVAVDQTAGWKTPELKGTKKLTRNNTIGKALFQVDLHEDDEDDDDEDDDLGLDITLTVINAALFVSVLAGWKGIWDLQDLVNVPPVLSVIAGLFIFVIRLRVDALMDTYEVHDDWFGEISNLPDLSFASARKYFQTFVAGFLSFLSTVLVWRGVWTAMDATNLPWPFWIVIGTVGYSGLSLLQRSITKEKIKEREAAGEDTEEPVGNPFFSNDDFFRRGFVPEIYDDDIDELIEEEEEEVVKEAMEEVEEEEAKKRSRSARSRSAPPRVTPVSEYVGDDHIFD